MQEAENTGAHVKGICMSTEAQRGFQSIHLYIQFVAFSLTWESLRVQQNMVKKETAQTQKNCRRMKFKKTEFPQIKYLGPIAFSRDDKQELKQASHGEAKKKIKNSDPFSKY